MISRLCIASVAALALLFANSSAQAQMPYDFQYGYTLGYQNSFANRLPTPPYFSVYPPVYYGKRYERPYGDSPYAAFPQLRSAPNYYAVPKDAPYRSSTVMNPHVEQKANVEYPGRRAGEPVAIAPRLGRTIEIINPFAQERFAGSR